MRDFSIIHTKIWHDAKFRTLNENEKLLFIYILSSPHGNMLGCFTLPRAYIAFDLNIKELEINHLINSLCNKDLIMYDAENNLVFVKNYLKHNKISGNNSERGCVNIFNSLPDNSFLIEKVAEMIKSFLDIDVKFSKNQVSESESNSKNPLSAPLEVPSNPIATHSEATCKPLGSTFEGPSNPLAIHLQAPSKPLRSPFEAHCNPLLTPLNDNKKDLPTPLQSPCKPLRSPFEAPLEGDLNENFQEEKRYIYINNNNNTNTDNNINTHTYVSSVENSIKLKKRKKGVKTIKTPPSENVISIFEHWMHETGHKGSKIDEDRISYIQSALDMGYTLESLKKAVSGIKKTPFFMGKNDRNTVYDGIKHIFKDASRIDELIRNFELSNEKKGLREGENIMDKKIREIQKIFSEKEQEQ